MRGARRSAGGRRAGGGLLPPGRGPARAAAAAGARGGDYEALRERLWQPSERAASLQPSKTMALTDLARAMRERGEDVISLAAGEPDFDTPAAIVEAGVAALRGGHTRYTANAGAADLTRAIARKLQEENGVEYDPASEVVVSNGAKQSVAQAVQAACGAGDEVLVPSPYWVSYPEMVKLAGAEARVLPTSAGTGFMLTPEQLEAALTPRSRLLILCTPSNPSGVVYPRERLEALARVVAKHPRLLVLSDEIYEHIVFPPAEHVAFASLPGMRERTLTVNGFSKAFAMTGWRLGYLAAPAPLARAAAMIQGQTTSGASSVAQKAGVAALGLGPGGGSVVGEMVAAFRERRDYTAARLAAMPGVGLVVPEGAFYLFPDVGAFFGPGVKAPDAFGALTSADDLCRYLLEVARVALVPGGAFGNPECLRISYAADLGTLEAALDRVEAALARVQRPAAPP